MTVYIEYAFLQNFLLDFGLLWLSSKTVRLPTKTGRLALAALLGGGFALVYPLLTLPTAAKWLLKWAAGALLCLLAQGKVGSLREWKRYGGSLCIFFALTFLFGGALTALRPQAAAWGLSQDGTAFLVIFAFFPFAFCLLFLAGKLFQRRRVFQSVYACFVEVGGRRARVNGFWDSGNLASRGGVPVCFLSADIFYDLAGEKWLYPEEEGGQGFDEMEITTLAGRKKVLLCRGQIGVETEPKKERIREVYFAPATNMIGREYKLIFNLQEGEG